MFSAEIGAWSKLLRENFVIVLLSLLYVGAITVMIHVAHDNRDQEDVNFMREVVTGVGGCLFGMLTKNTLGGKTGEPAATTTTTTVVRAEGPTIPPTPPPA